MLARRAVLGSVFLAAFGALLLLVYLRRYEREMSGGERVEVLTLAKAAVRGQALTEELLASRFVPVAYVEERAVRAAERAKVVGLPLTTDLGPQQSLLWTDLSVTTQERDLSALIAPGKRGVSVRASSDALQGYSLIRPGNYVDVIVTTLDPKSGKEMSATVLLQRVLVLAVGEDTGTVDEWTTAPARSDEQVLTLSLGLAEGQLLALALERGRLSVLVRNGTDPAIQADVPDVRESALLNAAERAELASKRAVGPVAIGDERR